MGIRRLFEKKRKNDGVLLGAVSVAGLPGLPLDCLATQTML